MAFELLWCPARFEFLHEIGGADYFLLQLADELDGSSIHKPDVRDVVFRRVLHRNVFATGEEFGQNLVQFFPSGVEKFLAVVRIEGALLDLMYQLARFTFCRNEVKPAPGDHRVIVQAEDVAGDGIAMVMVVKQPAVNFICAQFGLNGFNVPHEVSPWSFLASVCRRLAEREHSLARDTCDCDALVAAIFAGDDSNSREGHVQTPGEKASERFIRAAFKGGAVRRTFSAPA